MQAADPLVLHARLSRLQCFHRTGRLLMYGPLLFLALFFSLVLSQFGHFSQSQPGPTTLGQPQPLTLTDCIGIALAMGLLGSTLIAPVGVVLRAISATRLNALGRELSDDLPELPPFPPLRRGEFLGAWYVKEITPDEIVLHRRLAPPLLWRTVRNSFAGVILFMLLAVWAKHMTSGAGFPSFLAALISSAMIIAMHAPVFTERTVILAIAGGARQSNEVVVTVPLLLIPLTRRRTVECAGLSDLAPGFAGAWQALRLSNALYPPDGPEPIPPQTRLSQFQAPVSYTSLTPGGQIP